MKATAIQYAKTLLDLTENKTEKEISDVIARFVDVLKKDGQMKNSGKIIEKFTELFNANHGIVDAIVITRDHIEGRDLKEIEKYITAKYSAKEVNVRNVVDKKIKGGIVIRVGDEILDASVATQLRRLNKELVK